MLLTFPSPWSLVGLELVRHHCKELQAYGKSLVRNRCMPCTRQMVAVPSVLQTLYASPNVFPSVINYLIIFPNWPCAKAFARSEET